jgi:N-acetylglucosamine kinase-like BadF-type ATPase
MKLVADSGSTKTDWRIIYGQDKIEQARSKGINPYYQSQEEIAANLRESEITGHGVQGAHIKSIHFYGAGCNHPTKNQVVENALKEVFGQVEISINSDLLAVARGLCNRNAGIACILGTGSNSCYYDGKDIRHHIPPWGTWLGDEGSGSRLGRKLVILYLNRELPDHLQQAFEKRYPDLRETVMDEVYRKPYPNRYLGQFTRFLYHHMKDPFVYQLVYDGFEMFFNRKVLKYPNARQVPVQVSGSIGFYFNSILRKAAADLGLQVKNITESPIAGLTLYHLQD